MVEPLGTIKLKETPLMKNLFFILTALLLFGTVAYAGPIIDWSKYPGAKAIVDHRKQLADNYLVTGITISKNEDIENNPDLYSPENTSELLEVALLEDIPLSISQDFLSQVKDINKILGNRPLADKIKYAEKDLEKRPIEALLSRMSVSHKSIFC